MSEFLMAYVSFGAGFYIAMCSIDPLGFVKASFAGLLRGMLIGLVFWPIGLIYNVIMAIKVLED